MTNMPPVLGIKLDSIPRVVWSWWKKKKTEALQSMSSAWSSRGRHGNSPQAPALVLLNFRSECLLSLSDSWVQACEKSRLVLMREWCKTSLFLNSLSSQKPTFFDQLFSDATLSSSLSGFGIATHRCLPQILLFPSLAPPARWNSSESFLQPNCYHTRTSPFSRTTGSHFGSHGIQGIQRENRFTNS